MEADLLRSGYSRLARRILGVAGAAILALLSVPAASGAAMLQGSGEDAAIVSPERLYFEKKCFYDIPEWRGKGEEKFLERLAIHRKAYEADAKYKDKLPQLDELYGDCLWSRREKYEAEGNKEKVKEISRQVMGLTSDYGRLKGYKETAGEYLYNEEIGVAREALKSRDHTAARTLWKSFLQHPRAQKEAVEAFVRMDRQASGIDAANPSDLEGMSAVLDKVLGSIEASIGKDLYGKYRSTNPDIAEYEKRRDDIKNTTQWMEVGTFDVSAALEKVQSEKAPLTQADAAFVFEPVEEGKGRRLADEKGGPTKLVKARFLYYRGVYDVSVFTPGSKERPAAVFLSFTLGDAPAKLEIPNQVPEGMVYAGPWKTGGGFFVDVTEVTVGQVKALMEGDEVLTQVVKDSLEDDGAPAWFEEDGAEAFERASGKKIPTAQQWLEAAFGPYSVSQRPYPWGKEPPSPDRAYSEPAKADPQPVGGRAKGRSPFWAEDMAGNVAEWVRSDGGLWLLGGHFRMTPEELTAFRGKNPLREPLPGPEAYEAKGEAMSPEEREAFSKLKVDAKGVYVTGVRMVVPAR